MLCNSCAIIFKFYRKFYCKFYCSCDQSLMYVTICNKTRGEYVVSVTGKFDLTTPDWLYVLVTLRDGDDEDRQVVSRLGGSSKVELKAEITDAETVADVRRYLRVAMTPRIDRISLDGALAQLAKNAEANFLCATFLQVPYTA